MIHFILSWKSRRKFPRETNGCYLFLFGSSKTLWTNRGGRDAGCSVGRVGGAERTKSFASSSFFKHFTKRRRMLPIESHRRSVLDKPKRRDETINNGIRNKGRIGTERFVRCVKLNTMILALRFRPGTDSESFFFQLLNRIEWWLDPIWKRFSWIGDEPMKDRTDFQVFNSLMSTLRTHLTTSISVLSF